MFPAPCTPLSRLMCCRDSTLPLCMGVCGGRDVVRCVCMVW